MSSVKGDENRDNVSEWEKSLLTLKHQLKYHASMHTSVPGVRFFKEVNRCSIMKIEIDEPFMEIKLFELHGVDLHPLEVENLEYYPYPGCIFDVLKEPNNKLRFTKLKEFFKVLGTPGHISESVGLAYTIMHFWRFVYFMALVTPTPETLATFAFIMNAGLFHSMMRILGRCVDRVFLLKGYNRLIPYRILELIFAATQADCDANNDVVEMVLVEPDKAFDTFYPLICGEISAVEQLMACHVTANLSCYDNGVLWLMNYPKIVGRIGWHLWGSYHLLYRNLFQYEELQVPYMKHLIYSPLEVLKGKQSYEPKPLYVADLNTFIVLCCLCNVCATHLEGGPMDIVETSLFAVVKEGLFDHMGMVSYAIILNDNSYPALCMEKFLSFFSWSCFPVASQRIIFEQFHSLPTHRNDSVFFFDKDSFSKSRSVLALLITHANHLDYENGSHFVTLAIIYLLRGDEDGAMDLLRCSGDLLFDLSHSICHAQMPSKKEKAVSLKRVVLEAMLKFGGSSFINEKGIVVKPSEKRFAEPVPACIKEARDFCCRNMKEQMLSRHQKQKLVSCADTFKAEGNNFFTKKKYYSAIKCYTLALELCPLTCTERRVTYYSNRAECYLKTNQSLRAMRDCNKALSQNPSHLRTRWRRYQAFQNLKKRYPAALDLFTIKQHVLEAIEILGVRLYNDLDMMMYNLLDGAKFHETATLISGPLIVSMGAKKKNTLNEENFDCRHRLPPFTGQYYHEIFGLGRGDFSK